MTSHGASHVDLVEVSPRDGLQSDPTMLSTESKVELITRAVRSGFHRIEAVSFVNPARVPQMADADDVMALLLADDATRALAPSYIGLVLNRRGIDRALDAGVDEVNVVVVCSDTFAERNQGRDTAGLVDAAIEICSVAHEHSMPISVTLAASFGCPYEGEVPLGRLVDVVGRLASAGFDEIALADSIGVAVPTDVTTRAEATREVLDAAGVATTLRCHFHNTRNTGLANAAAALDAGVRVLDSSLGGIGGCPFSPNATGNVPSEDLAYMVQRMGFDTGIDLDLAIDTVQWMEQALGHEVPGYLAKAGLFP